MPPVVEQETAPQANPSRHLQKLLHDSSHYFFGLIGNMLLGFISFPIFTRALPMAEYGLIDLVQKVLLVVTAVAKLGLQNSALRFYNARDFSADAKAARGYYSTLFFGTAAPSVLCALLCVVAIMSAAGLRGDAAYAATLFTAAILIVPRSLQSIFWSFLRVEERTKAYNAIVVVTKAATILSICALIRWGGPSARLYFLATTIVEGLLVVALTMPLIRRRLLAVSAFDPDLFRSAFTFGLPLVINEVAFLVLDAGDRILVQHYLGADALGLYAVAYGLAAMAQSVLLMPLNLAVFPLYMNLWNAGEREKTRQFLAAGIDLLMLGCAGLFAVVAATAREVVILSASSRYAAAANLIPAIFAGLLIFTAYAFVSAGLMIQKKTGCIAVVMAASAIVNVTLNCLLLPRFGVMGAALATLIGNAFCIALMAHFSFKCLPVDLEWKRPAVYAAGAALALTPASIPVGALLPGLLLKAALSVGIYATVLVAADGRVRQWIRDLTRGRRFA